MNEATNFQYKQKQLTISSKENVVLTQKSMDTLFTQINN